MIFRLRIARAITSTIVEPPFGWLGSKWGGGSSPADSTAGRRPDGPASGYSLTRAARPGDPSVAGRAGRPRAGGFRPGGGAAAPPPGPARRRLAPRDTGPDAGHPVDPPPAP